VAVEGDGCVAGGVELEDLSYCWVQRCAAGMPSSETGGYSAASGPISAVGSGVPEQDGTPKTCREAVQRTMARPSRSGESEGGVVCTESAIAGSDRRFGEGASRGWARIAGDRRMASASASIRERSGLRCSRGLGNSSPFSRDARPGGVGAAVAVAA